MEISFEGITLRPWYVNDASQASGKALESAGFTLEASLKKNIIKNGIIQDSCIYSVLREGFKCCLPV
jgi:RimJ/RimL family protein N-acetyltransferase